MSSLETIAALADGELVDTEALTSALADPEGRAYLIDVLALRELTLAHPLASPTPSVGGSRRWTRWAGVAALVSVGVSGGYLFGLQTARTEFRAAATAPAVSAPTTVVTAPAPTWVIHLEPGAGSQEVEAN